MSTSERDTSPLSSRYDDWTGDPEADRAALVARAMATGQPTRQRKIHSRRHRGSAGSRTRENPVLQTGRCTRNDTEP